MSKKQKKPIRSFDESIRAGAPVFIADALRRGFGGIGAAMKRPFVLLPAVVLLLAQTALSVVKINAPDSTLVHILSLLTFAQGGMYAGFLGKVGGVIGKAFLAGMITKLFMKNKGQKTPKREKLRGGSFALLIPGFGAGLIVYNFLTGNACLENAMSGVTSAIAVFRMAGKSEAFLPGFVRSFRKGKTPAGAAKSVLLGVGAGLALGVLTSLRGGGYFCYALGAALLLIGLLLMLLTKNKRAVAAAAVLLCLSPLAGFVTTAQAAGDSVTLTLESLKDNVFYAQIVYDRPQVTLIPGENTSMELRFPADLTSSSYISFDYTYTFDFIWQGNDTWNCESSVFGRCFSDGSELADTVRVEENANVTIDKSLVGSELSIPIACITANDLPDSWLDAGAAIYVAETQVANFSVSGGSPLPAASGTWVLENTVYHGENGCGRTLNTPVIFDTVGKSTIMGWKFTNANNFDIPANVSVSNYPERIASGETFSIELGLNAHRASYACTWVGIDNCGMEQENFDTHELYDYAYGTLPKQGRLPKLVLKTADGNNVICTWWDSFGTPENFAEYTDRSEVFSAVMPDGTSFSARCSVYVGLAHTADEGELTPMVEFIYQWVPSGPAVPPDEEDADGGANVLFDEDGFFDGENWFGWDELSEHTDTDETMVTDAAAVAGGILAALLAAGGAMGGNFGGALGGIPPLPDSPYMRRDPDDPAYATLTGPGGVQSLYRYDEASGLWHDPYSDSYLEPGQIDRAMQDAQSDRAFSESVIGQMENRTDAASMRQKQMYKMEQQENRLWEKGGGYDPAIESRLAKQLQDLRRQMVSGGDLDVARYARVRETIGKLSRGEIKNESLAAAQPDERWSPGEIKAAMEMTSREINTGSSWKAWALRGVLAVGTGGASEKVFDVTGALYDIHDAVMDGDSDGKAFAKAVGNYMTGELVGDAAGAGLKKVGGAVADTKAGQKAMRAVGDLLDPAAKQADDAAKAAKRLSLAKNAEITTVGAAPKVKPEAAPKLGAKPQVELKTPQPKSKPPFDSLQSDKRLASVKQDAQANIQKELDKLRAKRGADPMQAAANQRASGKVDQLQSAMDELKRDPQNPVKQKAAEQAAMAVQQDKAGIRQMKQSSGVSAENRQLFNAMKTQKDQIATANTREILAKKYGVRPEQIQSIEPSNTMTTSELRKVGEADGIYRQPAAGSAEGATRFTEHDFPLDAENASKTGVSSDIDKTMRVAAQEVDPRTGQTVTKQYDIPASEVKAVYEEEFYRSWHGGELPTRTVNGKTVPDTEAIGRFAKEMDVSCNDKVSTESYSDLVEAMKKNGVKDFSDVEATSLTTQHKSTEWFNRADALEQNAGGDLDILTQAENLRTEGIRQATKQFENLTMRQAREINLARKIEVAKVPDTLIGRMEVLKRVDMLPPEGISTKEAEAILNGMGTSTEKTLEQFYAVTEMLNKWK